MPVSWEAVGAAEIDRHLGQVRSIHIPVAIGVFGHAGLAESSSQSVQVVLVHIAVRLKIGQAHGI